MSYAEMLQRRDVVPAFVLEELRQRIAPARLVCTYLAPDTLDMVYVAKWGTIEARATVPARLFDRATSRELDQALDLVVDTLGSAFDDAVAGLARAHAEQTVGTLRRDVEELEELVLRLTMRTEEEAALRQAARWRIPWPTWREVAPACGLVATWTVALYVMLRWL